MNKKLCIVLPMMINFSQLNQYNFLTNKKVVSDSQWLKDLNKAKEEE